MECGVTEPTVKIKQSATHDLHVWGESRPSPTSLGQQCTLSKLGTDLDAATQQQLDRGYRMVELLKQPQYSPMNVIDQVFSIFAGTRGYLDKIPVTEVQNWETNFLDHIHRNHQGLWDKLQESGKLSDEIVDEMKKIIEDFNSTYKVSEESA